ncbi:hypothetical protein NESM_000349800 [Novymonas esmeraldas]|uniref:Uncharacterized protein n=1 Tax=Novymonas esmeraldas TaxID=1808958 RepID=A0AAW0EN65_9TRYP
MEDTLENVGTGVREALQRLSDTRARVAAQRRALLARQEDLVHAVAPLLLPPCVSRDGQRSTEGSCLPSRPEAERARAVGGVVTPHCRRHRAEERCEHSADDVRDDAAPAGSAGAAAEAVRATATLSLSPPLDGCVAAGAPARRTPAAFHADLAARTQLLECRRLHYLRQEMVRAARLHIAQTWAREVLPWFDSVVLHNFHRRVVERVRRLGRRVARLQRRVSLDTPQYVPALGCARCTTRAREGPSVHCRQSHAERDDVPREAVVVATGCTSAVARGRSNGRSSSRSGTSTSPPGAGDVSHHDSLCSLWHQFLSAASPSAEALGDAHAESVDGSCDAACPLPAHRAAAASLASQPRSLRHVWYVITHALVCGEDGDAAAADEGDGSGMLRGSGVLNVSVQSVMGQSPGGDHGDGLEGRLCELLRAGRLLLLQQQQQQQQQQRRRQSCPGYHDGAPGQVADVRFENGVSRLGENVCGTCVSRPDTVAEVYTLLCAVAHLSALPRLCSGGSNCQSAGGARLPLAGRVSHGDVVDVAAAEEGDARCPSDTGADVGAVQKCGGGRGGEWRLATTLSAVYHAVPRALLQLRLNVQQGLAGASGDCSRLGASSPTSSAAADSRVAAGEVVSDSELAVQWWSRTAEVAEAALVFSPRSSVASDVAVYARAVRVAVLYRRLFTDVDGEPRGTCATPSSSSTLPCGVAPLSALTLPPLSASTRLCVLRRVELQARRQWQAMETGLSVARSMAAASAIPTSAAAEAVAGP